MRLCIHEWAAGWNINTFVESNPVHRRFKARIGGADPDGKERHWKIRLTTKSCPLIKIRFDDPTAVH